MTATKRDDANTPEPEVSEIHSELFHYTTISSLKGIIGTNTFWATRATHLNDSSEMELIWPQLNNLLTSYLEEEIELHLRRNPDDAERIDSLGGASKVADKDGSIMAALMRSKLLGYDVNTDRSPCPFHLFHRASQRRLGSPARTSF